MIYDEGISPDLIRPTDSNTTQLCVAIYKFDETAKILIPFPETKLMFNQKNQSAAETIGISSHQQQHVRLASDFPL